MRFHPGVVATASPSDIAGLNLWLKADMGVYSDSGTTPATNVGLIAQWNDQSGAGNHLTQSTTNNKPSWVSGGANSGVCFDQYRAASSAARILNLPAGYSTNRRAFTALIVVSINSIDRSGYLLNLGSIGLVFISLNGILRVFAGSNRDSTLRQPSSKCVLLFRCNASNIVAYLNSVGSAQNLTAAGASTITGGALGDASGVVIGSYHEIALFDNDIGASAASHLLNYAISRHSITKGASGKRLAIDGDSLTEGVGATLNRTWWRRMAVPSGRLLYSHGISGQTLTAASSDAGTDIDPLFVSDGVENWAFAKLGTNDLSASVAGATIYANLKTYCNARKSAGATKVVVWTLNPNSQATERNAFNALIRTDFTGPTASPYVFTPAAGITYADYLVDIAAHPNIGTGSGYSGTYFIDGVHMTDAGYQIEADIVSAGIPQLLT